MLFCESSACVMNIALFLGIKVMRAPFFVCLCNEYFFISRYLSYACPFVYLSV